MRRGATRAASAVAAGLIGALGLVAPASAQAAPVTETFTPSSPIITTAKFPSWTVPPSVCEVEAVLSGGGGGAGSVLRPGGAAGEATATLAVAPGTQIWFTIGQAGESGAEAIAAGHVQAEAGGSGATGSPGGAGGEWDFDPYAAGGGGGGTELRIGSPTDANDRVLVAGGGGGGAASRPLYPAGDGGAGGTGGAPGTDGGGGTSDAGGKGASDVAPGAGGTSAVDGEDGTATHGGAGATGTSTLDGAPFGGGGGGGGYRGGGGGGSSTDVGDIGMTANGGGGGGGSSWSDLPGATFATGAGPDEEGSISFTYVPSGDCDGEVPLGGAVPLALAGSAGALAGGTWWTRRRLATRRLARA